MSALRIEVLGRLRLQLGARVLEGRDVPGRQGRAALAYLILHLGTEVARADLAHAVWPDGELPPTWEDQINTVVSRLRSTLRRLDEGAPAIEGGRGSYRFVAADRVVLDLHHAERLLEDARAGRGGPRELDEAIALLSQTLLPAERGDWVERLRTHQRASLVAAYEMRAEHALRTGTHTEGIDAIERVLQLEPFRETAVQNLIRLHLAAGDRAGALRAYERFRTLLLDELGTSPSPRTEAVFVEALREESPADARGALRADNIPSDLSSFVGRWEERRRIAELVRSGQRLITLIGSGGIGKTRLAVRVAGDLRDRFPDGRWLVELEPAASESDVLLAIGDAIGLELAQQDPLDALAAALREREALVVLDGCERVVEAVAVIAERILKRCDRLHVLCTSQELLRVRGEVRWAVGPLSGPGAAGVSVGASEAVQLFLERAREADPSFDPTPADMEAVERICAALGGVPLEIELAAARLRSMTPQEIAGRMDRLLELLDEGARTVSPRQRSLRAMLDWTHGQLDPLQRMVLRRVSVFRGPFDDDAARAACADVALGREEITDVLASLSDRSLLFAKKADGTTRYAALLSVRQYGWERLSEAGEARETLVRLLPWALGVLDSDAHESRATLRFLANWACSEAGDAEELAEYVLAYCGFLDKRRALAEATALLERLLSVDRLPARLRTEARWLLAHVQFWAYHDHVAIVEYREVLAQAERAGDHERAGWALRMIANATAATGRLAEAIPLYDECHRRLLAAGVPPRRATAVLLGKANVLANASRFDEGRACVSEILSLLPPEAPERASALMNLSLIAFEQAELDEAEAEASTALALARAAAERAPERSTATRLTFSLIQVAHERAARGDLDAARRLCEEGLALGAQYEDPMPHVLDAYGVLLLLHGLLDEAVQRLSQAHDLVAADARTHPVKEADSGLKLAVAQRFARHVDPAIAEGTSRWVEVAASSGWMYSRAAADWLAPSDDARAAEIYASAMAGADAAGVPGAVVHIGLRLGDLSRMWGREEEARRHYRAAIHRAHDLGARLQMMRSVERLGILEATSGEAADGLRLLLAAGRERDRIRMPVKPLFRPRVEEALAVARDRSSERGRQAAAGADLDAAVAMLLG